jgi:hypothetical protein
MSDIRPAKCCPLRPLSMPMCLEEGMDLAHCQEDPLFGLLPVEDAHFGAATRSYLNAAHWPSSR